MFPPLSQEAYAGSFRVSSGEVTWGPAGRSRKLVPSMPDLAHRLPTCSSDCRGKARLDLGSVLPSWPRAAHLTSRVACLPEPFEQIRSTEVCSTGRPGGSGYLIPGLQGSEGSCEQKEAKADEARWIGYLLTFVGGLCCWVVLFSFLDG